MSYGLWAKNFVAHSSTFSHLASYSERVKLLVWDFDGTLAHREGLWSGTLAEVATQHAPELGATREQFRPFLSTGFRWHSPEKKHTVATPEAWWAELQPLFAAAFRSLGATEAQAAALAAKVRGQYIEPTRWRVFPDVVPTLRQLTAAGWTHAILTNHVPEFPVLLGALGLAEHFAFVVNSADTGFEKPHASAFAVVARQAGPLEQVCMVGDSLAADVAGASNFGWPAVLVRQDDTQTKWQAQDFYALPDVLNQMMQAEADESKIGEISSERRA